MKRRLSIGGAVVLLLTAGLFWWSRQRSSTDTPASTTQATAPLTARVATLEARQGRRLAALNQSARAPRLSPPVKRRFSFRGTAQPVVMQSYTPPFILAPAPEAREPELRKTVEGTLAVMHTAMAAGDFERWFALWDAESRAMMEGRWEALRQEQQLDSRARLTELWRKFASAQWRLTQRIEIPGFVLVDVKTDAAGWVSPLATLRYQDGRWWLSQGLQDSPIPVMAFLGDEVQLEDL